MEKETLKVFVVDDEPVFATTLTAILNMSGFSATVFTDPIEALASALQNPPHLVISDVIMPGLSGFDLAYRIKALCPQCKVMLFSGQANTVEFCYDAERIDEHFHILPKPLRPADLLKAIRDQEYEH